MGFLIVLVLLLVLGWFFITALGGILGFGLFLSEDKKQQKAEAQAPQLLDELFVGENASYVVTGSSMRYDTVVRGGLDRGYRLVGESGGDGGRPNTLVFARENITSPTE